MSALRRWLEQNEVKDPSNTETTGELVLHRHVPIMAMSEGDHRVLNMVNVNLKYSSKGREIVGEIEALINMGDHKTIWMQIAARLDIQKWRHYAR